MVGSGGLAGGSSDGGLGGGGGDDGEIGGVVVFDVVTERGEGAGDGEEFDSCNLEVFVGGGLGVGVDGMMVFSAGTEGDFNGGTDFELLGGLELE